MTTADAQAPASSLERVEIAAVESLKPAFENPAAQQVAKLAKLSDEPPLLALSAAVFAAGVVARQRRLRRAGARMIVAHLLATGFKNFVKNRVDRTRPRLMDKGEYRMEPGTSKAKELRSFPSGHSAGAFAIARAVSREYAIGPAAGLAAGLMAVLQVVRRAHFPSDAAAGAVLGILAETVSNRVLRPVLARLEPAGPGALRLR